MKASFDFLPKKFSFKPGGPADLELRRLEPADVPQLVALCREHAAFEQAAFAENDQAARLAVQLFGPRPAAYCLVVAQAHVLVGFATYMPEFSTWDAAYYLHLDCLFLRPEVRGSGVGRRVMEAVAAETQRLGCAQLQWQTPEFNAPAIAFYQRLGARPKNKLRFYVAAEQVLAVQAAV
ncbi:GNAT family N-acetyltransferase [Hymenobacter sp.]|uniref:GNAT family N-acetyltransferase n=1 Tax=Hymenobacter sp. TaxID=1898978 RepID=UPI00286A6E16|nr:GNAT family N-acetyltransferase [Hymenobacter sp.]